MTAKRKWKIKTDQTIVVDLWIAYPFYYDKNYLEQYIHEYVDQVGICVTVTDTDFIYTSSPYTGGFEKGVRIGFRNYPRFPLNQDELLAHASALGFELAKKLDQESFMIEAVQGFTNPNSLSGQPDNKVYWYTRREEDQDAETD